MSDPFTPDILWEPTDTYTDEGPHDVGTTYPIDPGAYGSLIVDVMLVDSSGSPKLVRLDARITATIENGAIIGQELVKKYTHADWVAAVTGTPPELSVASDELIFTFAGPLGGSVKATVRAGGMHT